MYTGDLVKTTSGYFGIVVYCWSERQVEVFLGNGLRVEYSSDELEQIYIPASLVVSNFRELIK